MLLYRNKITGNWVNDIVTSDLLLAVVVKNHGGLPDDYESFEIPKNRWGEVLKCDVSKIEHDEQNGTWKFPARGYYYLDVEIVEKISQQKASKHAKRNFIKLKPNVMYVIKITKRYSLGEPVTVEGDEDLLFLPSVPIQHGTQIPTKLVNGEASFEYRAPNGMHGIVDFEIECEENRTRGTRFQMFVDSNA